MLNILKQNFKIYINCHLNASFKFLSSKCLLTSELEFAKKYILYLIILHRNTFEEQKKTHNKYI